MTDWDAKWAEWAERDRRRIETEAHFVKMRREHLDRHVAIVQAALEAQWSWQDGYGGNTLEETTRNIAMIAIEALDDAGVVFARMSKCEHETP